MIISLFISGCGHNVPESEEKKVLTQVRTQKAGDSLSLTQKLSYPALVLAGQEAKIIAKMSGTVRDFKINTGEKVSIGQKLARIDDVSAGANSASGFNSSQIKHAEIAVAQAAASYDLSRKNYENTLSGAKKDLEQARLGQDSSATNKENTGQITAENLKAAQLSYEASILAREQAKSALDSRTAITGQSKEDIAANAELAAGTAADTAVSIIKNIDNITGLSTDHEVAYKNNLGVTDYSALSDAQKAYSQAEAQLELYRSASADSVGGKLDASMALCQKAKSLADAVKFLFDKSIPSADLPLSSLYGTSLSGLQSAAAGYQAQAAAAISQITSAKQGLANTDLSGDATLESLRKAYELAQKQEALAKQNVENLRAGTKGQLDGAQYGYESSVNQYNAAKIRIDSQIAVAKSQLDMAGLGYQNAVVMLQGLYDVHLAVSPINGRLTRKFASEGESVSAGQILATVSQADDFKLQFYANQEDLGNIRLGQEAQISVNGESKGKGAVSSIAISPDAMTKRYLVEVKPAGGGDSFALGSIVDIEIAYQRKATEKGRIILPLSAIEIGQNGSFIMVAAEGKAKRVPVEISKVSGETAELKTDLGADAEIIIEGNKLVADGEEIEATGD